MPGPSSVFDKSVVYRRKNWKKYNPERVTKELKWHKAGRKGAKKDIQEGKSAAPYHEKRDDCDQ